MKEIALNINGTSFPLPNAIKSFTDKPEYIIQTFITFLFFSIAIAGFIYMIINGFKWMTSGGNEETIKKARSSIIYTIVGMALAFLSFLFISLITNFFNIPFFLLPR